MKGRNCSWAWLDIAFGAVGTSEKITLRINWPGEDETLVGCAIAVTGGNDVWDWSGEREREGERAWAEIMVRIRHLASDGVKVPAARAYA